MRNFYPKKKILIKIRKGLLKFGNNKVKIFDEWIKKFRNLRRS